MSEISIFDVAQYFIFQSNNDGITAMKLHKLCYYAQAWHLGNFSKELFADEFQAWMNGPVNYDLYVQHRKKYYVNVENIKKGSIEKLKAENLAHLNNIWINYKIFSAEQLSYMTHQEDPWIKSRGDLPIGFSSENVISKEVIQEYYKTKKMNTVLNDFKSNWPYWVR